jgi:hypothetical protein
MITFDTLPKLIHDWSLLTADWMIAIKWLWTISPHPSFSSLLDQLLVQLELLRQLQLLPCIEDR